MSFETEELMPIVAELADKYTGKESTSITYEKARQLMEAVLYCIHEYEEDAKKRAGASFYGWEAGGKKGL